MADPIAPAVAELIHVFEEHLAGVEFPGVNDQALVTDRDAALAAHAAIEKLEAELALARERLEQAQAALLQRAHRAYGYARVYSEDKQELQARLDAVTLPRLKKPAASLDALRAAPPVELEAEVDVERDKPVRAPRRRKTEAQLFPADGLEQGERTPDATA